VKKPVAIAIVVLAVVSAVGIGLSRRGDDEGARCGGGFVASGAFCTVGDGCPSPLARTAKGCEAPDEKVSIPGGTITLGPSDWEAEGRVVPRSIHTQPFRIDAFEVTRSAYAAAIGDKNVTGELARAACNMTQNEAAAACRARGGRLPTEDEWVMAAVSAANPPRRYPWGDTGAVCRRAAWGLATGPCAQAANGPDNVGAHTDGDSALGVHDLAGNVAEWVDGTASIAKGGSWATALAADLRIWARLALPPGARDPRVGFRCVYAP
jgi:formylglycine-generating enzyme required for sulfatase activity